MWLICLAVIFCALIIIDTLRLGISPMPTTKKVRRSLLSMMPDEIEGTIYELGSGFGVLALRLALKYPKANIVAFEKAIIPFTSSWIVSLFVQNLTVHYKDFFQVDLSKADYLISYLFPGAMKRLAQIKIKGHLYSHTFRLPGHTPLTITNTHDLYKTNIYYYRFD